MSTDDVILRQGEPADDMCLIRRGQVVVSLTDDGTSTTLATLKDGHFLGEMSHFDGKPRYATVLAVEDVVAEAVASAKRTEKARTSARREQQTLEQVPRQLSPLLLVPAGGPLTS